MFDDTKLSLKVVNKKIHKPIYLPIDKEIEDLKLSEIPYYVGVDMDGTYVEVMFSRHDTSVSDNFAFCNDSETTVKEYTIFSLLYAVFRIKSMKNSISIWMKTLLAYIDDPSKLLEGYMSFTKALDLAKSIDNGVLLLEEYALNESKAKEILAKIIDESLLNKICDEIKPTDNSEKIFSLIKDNNIISEGNSK